MNESLLRELAAALQGLRYGSVEIVVHDSRVVQIERREKMRLTPEAALKVVRRDLDVLSSGIHLG